jgi:urea transporter
MKEVVIMLYRGLSWFFLYFSYLVVLLAILGLLINSERWAIYNMLHMSVVLYVSALVARLMAWVLDDFIWGSFREWNAS